jgi:tetratricopeptide (TPR) repeat protein
MNALTDRYGNALTTTSSRARDAYVVGVDRLLSADAGIDTAFQDAIEADEGFALAHIGLARTYQAIGRGDAVKAPLDRALALAAKTTPREQSHIAIFEKILTGQGTAAIPMICEHLKSWPRDAMALAPATSVFGLIAFSGRAGREVEVLDLLEPLAPAYGDDWWFRTFLAFAQIELQQPEEGLRNIEIALRGNPRNAHGAHVRAHLYYEMGEREEGLAFLSDWARDYPPEGQLHCHVNWHLALWSLETGRRKQAWDIFRTSVFPGGSWGPPINALSDSVSFMTRAAMAGETVSPDLWREISRYAAQWFPNSGVTFADVHSALAFAMAGDSEALRRIIVTPKGPAADILAPIARGFAAFADEDWTGVVREIEPVLSSHERIGGSRAQRDLLEYVVTCATLRGGRGDDARRLIATRRPQDGKEGGYPLVGL